MSEQKSILASFGGGRGVALMTIVLVAASGFYHWQNFASGDAMQTVGAELGLDFFAESQRRQLRGRIDEIGVAVETTTENRAGDTHWFTDFKLYASNQPGGRIVGASLRQKLIGGMQDSEWLRTGDTAFDEAVLVEGEPAEMLAYLNDEARAAVLTATDAGWQLEDLTWKLRESGRVTSAEKMRFLLDKGLAAARALRGDDVSPK